MRTLYDMELAASQSSLFGHIPMYERSIKRGYPVVANTEAEEKTEGETSVTKMDRLDIDQPHEIVEDWYFGDTVSWVWGDLYSWARPRGIDLEDLDESEVLDRTVERAIRANLDTLATMIERDAFLAPDDDADTLHFQWEHVPIRTFSFKRNIVDWIFEGHFPSPAPEDKKIVEQWIAAFEAAANQLRWLLPESSEPK